MKRIFPGVMIVAILLFSSPVHAAERNTNPTISGLIDSVSSLVIAISNYAAHLGIGQYALTSASSIATLRSDGKAFGPFAQGDYTLPLDGSGVFQGDLKVIVAENPRKGLVHYSYYVKDDETDIVVELQIKGKMAQDMTAGSKVRAVGIAKKGIVEIDATAKAGAAKSIELVDSNVAGVTATTAHRTIAIISNTSDKNVPCSPTAVDGILFNNPGNNVAEGLHSASHGQYTIAGRVVGPFNVPYLSTDSYSTIGNAGQAAATAAGIDLSQYDRIINVIPRNANMSFIGVAFFNSKQTWILECSLGDIYEHELGHNLNLDHAGRDGNEYADMGSFLGYSGVGTRHTHAFQMSALNWLPAASVLRNPGPGTYTINSSDMYPGSASHPQAIFVSKPDTNQQYVISYRTPTGYASKMPSDYHYQAQVHTVGLNLMSKSTFSFLNSTTPLKDTANNLTVSLVSSTPETATIKIEGACSTSVPQVSISPAEIGSTPGGTAQYSVTIKNNNSVYCPATSYSLSVTDTSSDLTSTLTSQQLTLSSGQSNTNTLSAVSSGSIGSGTQVITVSANGNGMTGSATAKYTIDATPPTSPSNVTAATQRKQVIVTWNSATDNIGVVRYELLRNGSVVGTSVTTSFADRYPVSGINTYQVRAYDAAGNKSVWSNSANVTVTGVPKRR